MPETNQPGEPQGTPTAPSTTPETPAQTPPATPPAEKPVEGENEAAKYRRLFEKSEKEREAAAKKLQEIEDAKLSELDKERRRAAELEAELKAERTERLRSKIAAEAGLASGDEVFIVGTDEDTMRESAKRLAERIGAAPKAAGTVTNPPAGQGPSIDEQIAAAEKAGNRNEAIRLLRQKHLGNQ